MGTFTMSMARIATIMEDYRSSSVICILLDSYPAKH